MSGNTIYGMLTRLRQKLRPVVRSSGTRSFSKPPQSHPLSASTPIQNILLVQKQNDARVSASLKSIISHINERYPSVTLFHEPLRDRPDGTQVFSPSSSSRNSIDLVITLGGDGTILHASSLFSTGPVPPVLSFSMGTLGFLLPFHIDSFEQAIQSVFESRVTVLPRMRLACTLRDSNGREIHGSSSKGQQVMNEVSLHRGGQPHLTIADVFVDDQHLTEAVSDGLIISTPTGSTAYSLSSGGPIVHPSVVSLLLTPICPMSLSFRPLLLPGAAKIRLRISEKSRISPCVSMDGREAGLLSPGDSVEVKASDFPIPCINRLEGTAPGGAQDGKDGWVRDINSLLRFNVSFKRFAYIDVDH